MISVSARSFSSIIVPTGNISTCFPGVGQAGGGGIRYCRLLYTIIYCDCVSYYKRYNRDTFADRNSIRISALRSFHPYTAFLLYIHAANFCLTQPQKQKEIIRHTTRVISLQPPHEYERVLSRFVLVACTFATHEGSKKKKKTAISVHLVHPTRVSSPARTASPQTIYGIYMHDTT